MYDLNEFSLDGMMACASFIKSAGAHARSFEEAANRVVRHLFDNLGDGSGGRACALVRLYKTHAYGELDAGLRAFADKVLGQTPATAAMRCLTLMATAGIEPAWNSRQQSNGHRAIPLSSVKFVEQAPMISQLIKQFGLDIPSVLAPDPGLIVDMVRRNYNIFHVPEARGSHYIPAQSEFVIPYNVRSVVGFGGIIGSGDMVAVILFSQVPIATDLLPRFKPMGPALQVMAHPFLAERTIFS
jgi:hypothetical protein